MKVRSQHVVKHTLADLGRAPRFELVAENQANLRRFGVKLLSITGLHHHRSSHPPLSRLTLNLDRQHLPQ